MKTNEDTPTLLSNGVVAKFWPVGKFYFVRKILGQNSGAENPIFWSSLGS